MPEASPAARAATPAAGSPPVLKVRRGRARKFVCQLAAGLGLLCWLGAVVCAWLAAHPDSAARFEYVLSHYGETTASSRLWLLCGLLSTLGLCMFSLLIIVRGRRREWERIMDLTLAQRGTFNRLLLGSLGVVLTQLSLPLLLGYMIDEIVNVRRDARQLSWFLALVALILLLRGLSAWLRALSGQSLAYRVAADLRQRLFGHLQGLSFAYFDRARQGDLISRLTNDVQSLQNFILNGTEDFFVAPFMVLGGLACVVFLNWQLALIIFISAGLLGVFMQATFRRLRSVNQAAQRELGFLTAQVSEGLNTIRLAQSFGIEQDQIGRFAKTNAAALGQLLGTAKLSARLSPFNEALGFTAPLVIIASMCYLAISQGTDLDAGQLLTIAGIGALVANPLGKLARVMTTLSSGEAASARIHELLDTKAEISDQPGAVSIDSCDGRLEFDDVSLSYGPGQVPALSNLRLVIEPGQAMAFVGESGSGKSSLVHLVPRFYEVSSGRVLLDGRDVRDISLASLRRQCAIVSQDTILIHGTIRENIAYGTPSADEKDIVDAAISANAHNFIMELEGGYNAIVGEKGVTLSGGQRQRIAIARALLRDPRILLLDEATSALDSHAEALVQDALNKLMYGRTTLVVAHRLSTVRNADRIVVLKAGRIVEQGSHDELLKNPQGEYSRLVKLQGLD